MKKKIYFTADVEFHDGDFDLGTTGNKTVNVYEVVDGEIKTLTIIDCELSDNSKEEIQNYLNDNGMGDDEFEIIQL